MTANRSVGTGRGELNIRHGPHDRCEVVVIGAGPAGSMAARELARRGIDVLLLERKALPRPKVCGACLNCRALSCLAMAGLSPLMDRLGAIPTRCFRACCAGRSIEIGLPGGVALSREAFDYALAQAAVDAGARLVTGITATLRQATPASDEREIELRNDAQQAQTIRAKIVLAADGLGHPSLVACGEFASRVSRPAKIGVRARIDDCPQACRNGTILMAVGRGGYVGMVRVEDGSLNVAAALDPAMLKRSGRPTAAVASILAEAGIQRVDLSSAAWQGTLPMSRQTARPIGHRVFVLGDAAGYVEPFTGEGMAWALAGGMAVADFA
ncbi:MAG: NAD(P)/FAD-dependent oxidoreductase, partial [Pirellulales bacterium]